MEDKTADEIDRKGIEDLFWEDGSIDVSACNTIKIYIAIYGLNDAIMKYGKKRVDFVIKEQEEMI